MINNFAYLKKYIQEFENKTQSIKDIQESKEHPLVVDYYSSINESDIQTNIIIPEEISSFSSASTLITLAAVPHVDTASYDNFLFANLALSANHYFSDRSMKQGHDISIKDGSYFFVDSDVEHWSFPQNSSESIKNLKPMIILSLDIDMSLTTKSKEDIKNIVTSHWAYQNKRLKEMRKECCMSIKM